MLKFLRLLGFSVLWTMVACSLSFSQDRLDQLIEALPDSVLKDAQTFSYARLPARPFTADKLRYMRIPGGPSVGMSFLKRDEVLELTGVDFNKVDAVFEFGQPPETVAILAASDADFAAGISSALSKRGFASSTEHGANIFAKGEDFAIDLSERGLDPFNGGLGKSQRIAIKKELLVSTAAWAPLRQALKGMSFPGDCQACLIWKPVLAALRSKAALGDEIQMASGYGAFAFVNVFSTQQLTGFVTGEKPADMPTIQPLTPSLAVLVAIASGEKGATIWIAMLADEDQQAKSMASVVGERLTQRISLQYPERVPPLQVPPSVDVIRQEPFSIALIGVPQPDLQTAMLVVNRWTEGILMKDFFPLAMDMPMQR